MFKKGIKKRQRRAFFSKPGLGTLLGLGFAMAVAIAVFIGIFSMYSLNKVSSDLNEVAKQSRGISSTLERVKEASANAAFEADGVQEDMNEVLVTMLNENAVNMESLLNTFEDLATTLKEVVESKEEDAAILLLQVEDVLDNVQKEWIPLVRGISEEITQSSEEGEGMADTIMNLHDSLIFFVDLAKEGSAVSNTIKRNSRASAEKATKTRNFMMTVLLLSIVGVVVVGFFTRRAIIRPIKQVTERVRDIAEGEGDLTKRIEVETKDEIGELAHQFNSFIDKIQDIIQSVKEATMNVTSSASEISASVEEQSAITAQQSTAVSEITSTMEELSATSTQIADNSQSVVEISNTALQNTEGGVSAAEEIQKKMDEISEDNNNNINQIVELGKKSKEISKVMEIINTVADQTKLIAFNAAIEASSAGEAGKRFGVVAVEIRRLADNVMESTGEIQLRIEEIQEAVNRLVIASEKSSKRVQEGNDLSIQTVNMLNNMLAGVQSTTESAKQISLSTQQQKTASTQVVASLKEIAEGAKQSSVSIQQTSATTTNLTNLSNDLKALVERFKLNGEGK